MATTTENLGLTLPAGTDRALVSDLNENFQTLDAFAGQATADIQQAQETANAAAPQATTYTKDEVDAAIEEAIEHGGGGTTDYTELTNKPSINGVVLTGNKTTSDLGIEENVQADWDEADTTAPSYIKNKPNIPAGVVVDTTYDGTSENAQAGTAVAQAISTKVDKVTGKGLSTNDFTNADKAKLDGIESGAEANVQANWIQTDNTADDYIKNKPTIPAPVTVDQTYSATSSNAQSGVAVAQAISTKVDKETGKGLSTNDFTTTEKNKLSGIEAGATKTIVDTDLSSTSTNPVQNKAVQAPIARLVDAEAKNVLNIPESTQETSAGATFVSDGKNTIAISGTVGDPWGTWSFIGSYSNKDTIIDCTDGNYVVSVSSETGNINILAYDYTGSTRKTLFSFSGSGTAVFSGNITNIQLAAKTGTFSGEKVKIMLCTAEDYAISPEFVPYTPTMRELYEMILAMQNGG